MSTLPNLDAAGTAIRNREPFTIRSASMRADERMGSYGYLPELYRAELHARRAEVAYVVYSYATPIAWVYESGERVIPRVSYSVTTARHQSIARSALAVPWEVDRAGDGVTFTATAMPKGARRPDRREVLATGVPGTFDAIYHLMLDHPDYSRWELTAERADDPDRLTELDGAEAGDDPDRTRDLAGDFIYGCTLALV